MLDFSAHIGYNNEAVSERGTEQEKIMKLLTWVRENAKKNFKKLKKVLDKPKTV